MPCSGAGRGPLRGTRQQRVLRRRAQAGAPTQAAALPSRALPCERKTRWLSSRRREAEKEGAVHCSAAVTARPLQTRIRLAGHGLVSRVFGCHGFASRLWKRCRRVPLGYPVGGRRWRLSHPGSAATLDAPTGIPVREVCPAIRQACLPGHPPSLSARPSAKPVIPVSEAYPLGHPPGIHPL